MAWCDHDDDFLRFATCSGPSMLGEDAPSFLGDLQWGSVCLNGTESSFLWAAVQPFCEDVRICALA